MVLDGKSCYFCRAVFQDILVPLLNTWVDMEVVRKLREHLVVFEPGVSDNHAGDL
jgi:hypothetical protein